jgi:hypothetical protein
MHGKLPADEEGDDYKLNSWEPFNFAWQDEGNCQQEFHWKLLTFLKGTRLRESINICAAC